MDAEILIPLSLFASVASVMILFRKFTNDERLALIEKGADASIFNKKPITFPAIKIGLLLFGSGLGLLIGSIISTYSSIQQEAAIFSCILLFGGLGLFISFFIENYLNSRKSKQQD